MQTPISAPRSVRRSLKRGSARCWRPPASNATEPLRPRTVFASIAANRFSKGASSGPAIVPGDPDKSVLIRALRYVDDLKMPPDKRLPETVVADFERWVRDGATWPPVGEGPGRKRMARVAARITLGFSTGAKSRPTPRCQRLVGQRDRRFHPRGTTDSHGLKPGAAASSRTLLRRAYFDLIGLPPHPETGRRVPGRQVAGSIARTWSRRCSRRRNTANAGAVTGWTSRAMPTRPATTPTIRCPKRGSIATTSSTLQHRQAVRRVRSEQIAGDILAQQGPAEKYSERVVATGFLALSRRYATAPYELWHLTLEDTIDTVGRAYLGMTLRCARCHDHKFDPISTRDYYALYGVFASTRYPYAGSEEFQSMKFGRRAFAALVPAVAATPAMKSYKAEMSRLKHDVAQLAGCKPRKPAIAARTLGGGIAVAGPRTPRIAGRAPRRLCGERGPDHRRGNSDSRRAQPARGEGSSRGATLPFRMRGAPPGLIESGRLELADWLASPRNPLTARVMVNRVWQHHFGRGIVATPSNFGTRGSPPSHPELLDWLTATFVEHGWSIKSLHRLIMPSKTYQLASDVERGRRGDRSGQPVVLAVQSAAARRRGDSRRDARRERRA